MLKRKNKEKKIYKDKNASLQFEKQKLYIALLNREKEIERLHSIIKEVREYIETLNEYGIGKTAKKELLEILDKENK